MRDFESHTAWKPILSGPGGPRRTNGIYSARELSELIVYERARADRTGEKLSVVLCGMNGQSESRRFVNRAVQALSRSIRNTDHLGWYDPKCLAVVLPLTSTDGASKFLESLAAVSESGGRSAIEELEFSIHSYPDTWFKSEERIESESHAGAASELTTR